MKKIFLVIPLVLAMYFEGKAQAELVIEPSQSMIVTGKGQGQDATINPYFGQACYAVVNNIGKRAFSIRVQQDGKIVEEISIAKGELREVKLLKDYSLFLDPNPNGIAKASVAYKKINE